MIYIKKEKVILEDPEVKEDEFEEEEFTVYDFENMEFGLDALAALEDQDDDDVYDGIEEYDREEEDLEAETANYVRNRESVMTDEEIEDLISRYMMIKDRKSSTFKEIVGILKDLRRACEESKKKHGNIHVKTDDDDERKVKKMYQATHQLNDVDKALIMMYLDDKDYSEISRILGITEGNARVKMNRARNKLKQLIKNR